MCMHACMYVVTNKTFLRLGLDTTTRDFDSDDTKIVTYPKPLVNGFTRNISVSFTVQHPQKRSVIAFIEVKKNLSCFNCIHLIIIMIILFSLKF